MKPQKPMQETLRYKNYVANLRHQPPYAKEAALLKEIAGGVQWRMDAAIEAIVKAPNKKDDYADMAYVSQLNVMKQAAMFGRLQTTRKLAAMFGYTEEDRRHGDPSAHAAFEVAVTHGHYKVADYLHAACKARPDRETGDRTPPARSWALHDGDLKKIAYLADKGENASHMLVAAMSERKNTKAVVDLLLSKGADVNYGAGQGGFWTPFLQAVKLRRFDMAELLLSKGADPAKSGGEVILNLIQSGNHKLLQTVLDKGAEPSINLLQHAFHDGNIKAAEMMLASPALDINAQGGAALLSAVQCKKQEEAVRLCLSKGADPAIALRTMEETKPRSWEPANPNAGKVKEFLSGLIADKDIPAVIEAKNTPKPPQP